MLVLTRKAHEAVIVGPSSGFERLLKVTVLGITAGKVRLGFEVAGDVPVHRLEVWERIRAEQADAPADLAAAPNEESDRWDNDGGRWNTAAEGHAPLGASSG